MLLCSPTGVAMAARFVPPARPARLDGLRIGLLDNTKAPVDKMMTHLAARLAERFPRSRVFSISKGFATLPAEPEVLAALRENCDVVINALGD